MKKLSVLVACEYSQTVTKYFRARGHDAFSCDILPTDGNPDWHYQCDIKEVLAQNWDMIIAFPPCSHLAVSGSKYFKQKIADGRQQQGIDFFMQFANHPCPRIAIENPIGIMSSKWRKPDQIIQPFEYGHPESKKTCLWLKGLPLLKPTNVLQKPACRYWNNCTPGGQNKIVIDGKWIGFNDSRTAHVRSKTYEGIGKAMSEQWSDDCSTDVQMELPLSF